ncbi:MAG: M14 family metallocarboxypeptidase [Planctomycetota bacterium]
MTPRRFHPIGTPGQPWTAADRREWLQGRTIQRSYRDEVLARVEQLGAAFAVDRYGALSFDPARYPLLVVRTAGAPDDAPWVLVTGGVHGYETSGVQGALAFLKEHAHDYAARVHLVVAPCVSPWGYEVIHRWNPHAVDPNRSFTEARPAEEAAALMALVAGLVGNGARFLAHLDLHETTDTDETEFRPALAARDGKALEPGSIPDGFYTVGDTANPQPEFQAAIIRGVERVTHIAPPDENGEIIGSKVVQHGVILYPFRELGLCAGVTDARFTTTTEVYPDSPKATPQGCIEAQVAAVRAGLDHALAHG